MTSSSSRSTMPRSPTCSGHGPFRDRSTVKLIDALSRGHTRVRSSMTSSSRSPRRRPRMARSTRRSRDRAAPFWRHRRSTITARTNVLGGDDNLAGVYSRAAAANLAEGVAGALDRFPYAVGRLESVAVATAERTLGRRVPRSGFAGRGARIDFRGPPGTVTTVSFSAVLAGRVDPAVFRGRIVVVGATAPSLQDLHPTPTSSKPMSGPEVQANAIWTAMHGLPLRDAPLPIDVGLVASPGRRDSLGASAAARPPRGDRRAGPGRGVRGHRADGFQSRAVARSRHRSPLSRSAPLP